MNLGPLFGSVAPMIATALGGPLAGAAVSFLASKLGVDPAVVEQTVAGMAPADLVKMKELDLDFKKHLADNGIALEVAGINAAKDQVEAVNKTLQTEAMGGSWLQKNHHAIECLASVGTVIGIYFVLPILSVPVPSVPETAWIMLGAFTGVTAWQRGKASIVTATGASNA